MGASYTWSRPHKSLPHQRHRSCRFNIGFDVSRRHQPDVVPEYRQLATPMIGGAAGLDADQAGREPLEEFRHFRAAELLADGDLARRIDGMDLKCVLCKNRDRQS